MQNNEPAAPAARDYVAEYRAARVARYAAETFTEQFEAADLSDRILDDADAAGVDIPIAAIEREVEPAWPSRY